MASLRAPCAGPRAKARKKRGGEGTIVASHLLHAGERSPTAPSLAPSVTHASIHPSRARVGTPTTGHSIHPSTFVQPCRCLYIVRTHTTYTPAAL
eukprot:2136235-Prymnesium_polylepis.1